MERPLFSMNDLTALREWYAHYFQTHSYPQVIRDYRVKRFDNWVADNRLDEVYTELRMMGVRFKEDELW